VPVEEEVNEPDQDDRRCDCSDQGKNFYQPPHDISSVFACSWSMRPNAAWYRIAPFMSLLQVHHHVFEWTLVGFLIATRG
jgi:hypothetical protein